MTLWIVWSWDTNERIKDGKGEVKEKNESAWVKSKHIWVAFSCLERKLLNERKFTENEHHSIPVITHHHHHYLQVRQSERYVQEGVTWKESSKGSWIDSVRKGKGEVQERFYYSRSAWISSGYNFLSCSCSCFCAWLHACCFQVCYFMRRWQLQEKS